MSDNHQNPNSSTKIQCIYINDELANITQTSFVCGFGRICRVYIRNISQSCGIQSVVSYIRQLFSLQQFIPIKHLKMNRFWYGTGAPIWVVRVCVVLSHHFHTSCTENDVYLCCSPSPRTPFVYSVSFSIYSCRLTTVIWPHVKYWIVATDSGNESTCFWLQKFSVCK